MKKLFTLIAVAAMAFAAQATELTVAEGTGQAEFAPFYGMYMDTRGTICQVIYPADMLSDMKGGTITEIKFYPTAALADFGTAKLQVALKEVEQDHYTDTQIVEDATVVATDYVVAAGENKLVIELATPFEYNGGNLMIETKVTVAGGMKSTKFYGSAYDYAVGLAQYTYSWSDSYYYETERVLPKATFTYAGAAPVEHTYTVAGTENLFGSFWDPSDTTNDMVKGEDGIYTWTKNNVVMNMGDTIEFKVVEDHSWDNHSWPEENYKYVIPYDNTYDIVITFNPESGDVTFDATGQNPVSEMVYTVVGPQDIFGSNWNVNDEANNMEKDEDGIYTWSKDNVALYGNFGFKVVGNHSYDIYQWPTEGNWTANLTEGEGIYSILITFDPEAEENLRITCTLTKTGEIGPLEHTYTVAGTENLFVSFWNPSDTTNDMVKGEDGIYTWTKNDVVFDAAASIEFRIVQDHAWTYAWPVGNWVINDVTEAGTYSFVITFNPAADDAEKIHVTVTKAAQGLRGDVNNDTKVDIADATTLINYLLYGEAPVFNEVNANCDLQGGIDISDATSLINFLLYGTWGN